MNSYLIWLEWSEKCFRANDADLKFFRSLVSKGSRVVRVKSERAFIKALPKATHVVTWHFSKEWYKKATNLKMLATPAAGRELVAWQDAPKGVKVHFGTFHGSIISETVLGFLLAWTRGFFWKGPLWPRSVLSEHCGDLEGTTAVIAGFGKIGRAIASMLMPFGVTCHGITRHTAFPSKALLSKADWFIMALPSDTGTDDFLDEKLIRKLSRKCVIINVGRGNSVDEKALLAALKDGRIAGAYLDVYKYEPTIINPELGKNGKGIAAMRSVPPNLVRMPHSSAFSSRYMKECFRELAEKGLLK